MIPRLVRSTLTVVAVAGVVTGCGDPSGPDAVAGTYRMQRFEGQLLPAYYMSIEGGVLSLVEEHMILGDDGKGVVTTVYEQSSTGRRVPVTRGLDYVVRGSRIEITLPCLPSPSSFSPAASCVVGPHLTGERIGVGLALGSPVSSKPASTYQRVR